MSGHRDELERLLIDWETGTLDEAEIERVRQLLTDDVESRQWYLEHQQLTASLSEAGTASPLPAAQSIARDEAFNPVATNQVRRPSSLLLIAVVLIGALVTRLVYLESRPQGSDSNPVAIQREQEARSSGIALVTRLVDVQWGVPESAVGEGEALSPGRFAIQSGLAQLEFFCGATVIVEGPAVLNLKSPMLADVLSGQLRASVPPAARGFALQIDGMKVVDLGTEFGLRVGADSASVQVFDGEVEVHHGNTQRNLTTGQGLRRAADGAVEVQTVDATQFPDRTTIEDLGKGQSEQQYELWLRWSEQVRNDPRLIACYSFDDSRESWGRRLPSTLLPNNSELDGAIVGAKPAVGRWDTKRALEFKHPADRVRVRIPGEHQSLTFASWVRIDSLDRLYNSLFLTDGYNKGEPHWQILNSGELYFSVRPTARDQQGPSDFKALSPSFWNPSLSGRWIHLACVYNVDSQTITHFLNGDVLSRHNIPREKVVPTCIGAATIGNWSQPTRANDEFAIRNLNGRMDEFLIFAAALTDAEVREICKNGRPWSQTIQDK